MPKTAIKEKFPSEEASTYYDGYLTDNSDGVPYVVKATSNGSKKWVKQEQNDDDDAAEDDALTTKMKTVELSKKAKTKTKTASTEEEDNNTKPNKNAPDKVQKQKTKKVPELVAVKSSDEPHIEDIVKKKPAATVKPKRAPTAYNTFVAVKLKELRLKHPGLASTEYMKMAGAQWTAMSDVKKKHFAEKHPTAPAAA
jgi:hypothetical protein